MISKARIKLIKSLSRKKYRKSEGLFLVEGAKNVLEVLNSDYTIHSIYGTASFYNTNKILLSEFNDLFFETDTETLSKIGTLAANNSGIAVVKVKPNTPLSLKNEPLILILDNVQDPGNLGTIIRIADWYGVGGIVLSNESVDLYNPKTIQSSMGSFVRVGLFYTNLVEYLKKLDAVKLGAFMDGENVYQFQKEKKQIALVMGSESHGISQEVERILNGKISIPRHQKSGAESLNVAVASAILLDNLLKS